VIWWRTPLVPSLSGPITHAGREGFASLYTTHFQERACSALLRPDLCVAWFASVLQRGKAAANLLWRRLLTAAAASSILKEPRLALRCCGCQHRLHSHVTGINHSASSLGLACLRFERTQVTGTWHGLLRRLCGKPAVPACSVVAYCLVILYISSTSCG